MNNTTPFPASTADPNITPIAKLQNTFTKELVAQAHSFRIKQTVKTSFFYFIGLVALALASFYAKNSRYSMVIWVATFFYLFLFIIVTVLNVVTIHKQFKTETQLENQATEYSFYPTFFTVSKPQAQPLNEIQAYAQSAFAANKILYSSLKKIVETQDFFYLFTFSTNCFAMPKTGFVKSNAEDLQEFFKKSFPSLKYHQR